MTEDELLFKWQSERPIYEAWGKHVASRVVDAIGPKIAPLASDVFLRLPPKHRLKGEASFLEKAFYRNKNYADAYNDITDKVGVRFVVLLANDIHIIEEAITACAEWDASKDRDYEQEQNENPIQFDYAAIHYVVRCRAALVIEGIEIPVGTPCEVQVKTILQHAYSELTHDTIYKPNVDATPKMRRSAAKSMALIEATNDYFQLVVDQVASFVGPVRNTTDELALFYRERVGKEPELTRAEGLILDAYEVQDINATKERLRLLLSQKAYLPQRIAEKASHKLLFRQPSILLVYMLAAEEPTATKQKWPLTPNELRPIYTDLGMTFDSY